jgi:hypothetical protein
VTFLSLVEDPEMTSAVMIHTFNKSPEKVKVCVETLVKYLDNIINHPDDDKFRKIRANNKAFQVGVGKFNTCTTPFESHIHTHTHIQNFVI